MKVGVTYIDETSLAPEEIVAQVKKIHGETSVVTIGPDNSEPFSIVYFAFQELITARQIDSFHDDGVLYASRLMKLKEEALRLAEEAITQVIKDNEDKLI